jgi:RimJ/RimL family protein N-acetyltransferase
MILETPRLILRQWLASDYDPFINLNSDADVMEFFPSALTADETLAHIGRITGHIDQHGYGLFALERKDNNEFIGFTGLAHPRFESYFTPCVEIGWRLSKLNWGNGFATEAAQACLTYGFTVLALPQIYSFTSLHNKRSQNVMIRIGMKKEGLFDHPLIAADSFLSRHVLYKINRPENF